MIPPLNFSGGTSGAGTGGSSARSDHSGWNVAAPGSVAIGGGGSICPWVLIGGGLLLYFFWKKK